MAIDAVDRHDFGAQGLAAAVLAQGAELCLLRDGAGQDYLWPAGPAWPRHAPVLFPIVGRLRDDTLFHRGKAYRLTQHGFARDLPFNWIDRTASSCRLVLTDTEATRAQYPFSFRFEIVHEAQPGALETTYTVINTGDDDLPVSLGTHTAFRWPLVPGTPKEAYGLTFEADETAPLRGVAGGLLTSEERATPISGRHLALNEGLFVNDALILPAPASRSVRYGAEAGPALAMTWEGFPQLGIWSRAGGDFLCIEPWLGMASPADFNGAFAVKPWLATIPRGKSLQAKLRIDVAL